MILMRRYLQASFTKWSRHLHETWGEGLSVYHNPNALRPLPEELFPSIAHHKFDNRQIRSHVPEFHPFGSVTNILIPKDDSESAPEPEEL